MSSAMVNLKCPNCDSSSIEWEGYNHQEDDQTHCVCTDCGTVLTEGSFKHDVFTHAVTKIEAAHPKKYIPSGLENSTLPDNYLNVARAATERTAAPEGKKVGIRKIRELINFICGPHNKIILEACLGLFYQVYEDDEFKYARGIKKEHIVATCVYITCRNNDIAISLEYICGQLNCTRKHLFCVIDAVKNKFGIEIKGLNVEALVDKVCTEGGIESDVCTRVKKVLPLFGDCLTMTGLKGPAFIKAVCYIAWQSFNVTNCKVSFGVFLKKHKWTKNKFVREAHGIIQAALKIQAGSIPWISSNVTKNGMIAYYLEDILTYQKTVLHDSKCEQNVENANNANAQGQCDDGDQKDHLLSHGKRKLWDVECSKSKILKISENSMRAKEIPVLSDNEIARLDSEELTEKDVNTEELAEYLRSPEEILQIHKLKALME